jgi:DNA-binding PadR family transcriptional regulator
MCSDGSLARYITKCDDAGMASIRDLRGSRLDVAVVLTDRERTAHEIAKALGKPTGAIFGVVRRMHSDGILDADSDPDPPTRGTQYSLSESGAAALGDALAEEKSAGQISEGQRLIMVERRKGLKRPNEVVGGSDARGLIEWGLEFPDGWLLVLVEGADPYRIRKLQREFEDAGCRCHDATVDAVLSAALLRRRARDIAGIVEES